MRYAAVVFASLVLFACDSTTSNRLSGAFNLDECTIDVDRLQDGGVGIDGIPALTDPPVTDPENIGYLRGTDRVIGVVEDGRPLAIPHNILWYHEVANFTHSNKKTAVTYCPLTGSSLIFDRGVVGGAEFGVSGLLFSSNLTMYDRSSSNLKEVSLWPQMNREAGCGSNSGLELQALPVIEMTWDGWRSLHPDTKVLTNLTGFPNRDYTLYPYADYETVDNPETFGNFRIDPRRQPKERVLGLPDGSGGTAFPFLLLDEASLTASRLTAVNTEYRGRPVVIFWDGEKEAATAFYRDFPDGSERVFSVSDDAFLEDLSGSLWRVDGLASAGPAQGEQLEPVAEAYVAFWFAWALFQPATDIWEGQE